MLTLTLAMLLIVDTFAVGWDANPDPRIIDLLCQLQRVDTNTIEQALDIPRDQLSCRFDGLASGTVDGCVRYRVIAQWRYFKSDGSTYLGPPASVEGIPEPEVFDVLPDPNDNAFWRIDGDNFDEDIELFIDGSSTPITQLTRRSCRELTFPRNDFTFFIVRNATDGTTGAFEHPFVAPALRRLDTPLP